MAPSLSPSTGEELVSVSLNKAPLWGKRKLQISWCLSLRWPQSDYGVTQTGVHLYIPRSHPSLNDQYIIIKASLLHNGFDAMERASETQFRGHCQLSAELSVLVQRGLTNVYFAAAISSWAAKNQCFMSNTFWHLGVDDWHHTAKNMSQHLFTYIVFKLCFYVYLLYLDFFMWFSVSYAIWLRLYLFKWEIIYLYSSKYKWRTHG